MPTTNSAQPFKIDNVDLPSTSSATKPIPKAAQRFTFKCYKCGEAGHKDTNCKKGGVNAQGKGKALMIEVCEDQEDEEFPIYEEEEEEEEEEMCDNVLIVEDNRGGECIQEPVYDQYMEEVGAHIEEEKDLSLATNVLQVPTKEMEDDEWLRRSSYKDMVSQEVFNNLQSKNQDQPQPQKLSCFKKGGEVRDSRKFLVFLINDLQEVFVMWQPWMFAISYLGVKYYVSYLVVKDFFFFFFF